MNSFAHGRGLAAHGSRRKGSGSVVAADDDREGASRAALARALALALARARALDPALARARDPARASDPASALALARDRARARDLALALARARPTPETWEKVVRALLDRICAIP